MLYLGGERFVPGHSLVDLLERAATSPEALLHLRDSARQLDQYYIPTRYPNGLPGGVPAEVFSDAQAEDAVGRARSFIDAARALLSAC